MFRQFIAVCALSLSAASAFGHGKLEQSAPPADAVLAAAPKQISLRFNEALETSFSKISVSPAGNASAIASGGAADASDARSLVLPLPALSSGEYQVHWSVMTHDGHKSRGDYRFRIK